MMSDFCYWEHGQRHKVLFKENLYSPRDAVNDNTLLHAKGSIWGAGEESWVVVFFQACSCMWENRTVYLTRNLVPY